MLVWPGCVGWKRGKEFKCKVVKISLFLFVAYCSGKLAR